jgi:hypothetical protein
MAIGETLQALRCLVDVAVEVGHGKIHAADCKTCEEDGSHFAEPAHSKKKNLTHSSRFLAFGGGF